MKKFLPRIVVDSKIKRSFSGMEFLVGGHVGLSVFESCIPCGPGFATDTRMMSRALIQRWPISQEQRQQIVERLVEVATDPATSPREFMAAAKALISCEQQNQRDDHQRREHPSGPNRFLDVARQLGIPAHKLTNGSDRPADVANK